MSQPEQTDGVATLPAGLVELPQAQPPPHDDPAPLSILHAAMAKGIMDPTYLGKLLDLQERWEDRAAQVEYNRAMIAVQTEIRPITKDGKNNHTQKRYATLEAVQEAITPIYLKHGFAVSFSEEVGGPEGVVRLRADVSHAAGHTRCYHGDFPHDDSGSKGAGNKTPIQATGSAISYGKRYMLGMIFNLQFTERPDRDGQSAEQLQRQGERPKVNNAELAEVRESISECNAAGHPVDEQKLLAYQKIAKLEDLPRDQLGGVLFILNRKRRGKA